jgi:hypothetical protein
VGHFTTPHNRSSLLVSFLSTTMIRGACVPVTTRPLCFVNKRKHTHTKKAKKKNEQQHPLDEFLKKIQSRSIPLIEFAILQVDTHFSSSETII